MNYSKLFSVLIILFIHGINVKTAQNFADQTQRSLPDLISALYPTKVTIPPQIDGYLNEPMWSNILKVSDFKTYSPDYGRNLSVSTECYMAYDQNNLYFAFNCKEPGEIKSSIAGRDEITSDDLVCINLDTFGDQQNFYSFYINPEGIQADSRDTRTNQDFQFNALWDCESILNDNGYTVEVRIPLQSIRFPASNLVKMRILIHRNLIIRNEKGTFPPMDPQKGDDFLTQSIPIIYEGLSQTNLLEILPAFTYSYKESNEAGRMTQSNNASKLSLTGKYGITQDLVLDATYNPDFSQVEADAGQIDVNLRYQLYYPEARPFFLEGIENFSTAIGPRIIHTRKIVNPIFGAKLTGKFLKVIQYRRYTRKTNSNL